MDMVLTDKFYQHNLLDIKKYYISKETINVDINEIKFTIQVVMEGNMEYLFIKSDARIDITPQASNCIYIRGRQ